MSTHMKVNTVTKAYRKPINLDSVTHEKIDILRTEEDKRTTFSKAGLVRKLVDERIKQKGLKLRVKA